MLNLKLIAFDLAAIIAKEEDYFGEELLQRYARLDRSSGSEVTALADYLRELGLPVAKPIITKAIEEGKKITKERVSPIYLLDKTNNGHIDDINSISFGPNNLIATASSDGTAKVIDLLNQQLLFTLDLASGGHMGKVLSAAISPDGKHLATSGEDKTVIISDIVSKEALIVVNCSKIISSLAWSPDGSMLACGEVDRVKFYKFDYAQREKEELRDASLFDSSSRTESPIKSLAWLPNGRWLAAARGSNIDIIDVARRGIFKTVWPDSLVNQLAWCPKGSFIAAAEKRGVTSVINVQTGEEVYSKTSDRILSESYSVLNVSFHPDGELIVSSNRVGRLRIANFMTKEEIISLGQNTFEYVGSVWSPDGQFIATVGFPSTRIDAINPSVRIFRFEDILNRASWSWE
ncbi:MAG: hypothetical protein HQ564_09325 [Candidatus Saganbacteria bacterium]|nr:hypothetical protein [Candidatus Saganbacteria bacterium]